MTTAADDRYIVLQHLCNRRLTAAATGRQYDIHPDKTFNLFVRTDRTSVKFSPENKTSETKSNPNQRVGSAGDGGTSPSSNGKAGLVPPSPALLTR